MAARKFQQLLSAANRVVVLTGAGVSAESGVPTFRGSGGLWRKYVSEHGQAGPRDAAGVVGGSGGARRVCRRALTVITSHLLLHWCLPCTHRMLRCSPRPRPSCATPAKCGVSPVLAALTLARPAVLALAAKHCVPQPVLHWTASVTHTHTHTHTEFYHYRRDLVSRCSPNPAHYALAAAQQRAAAAGIHFRLITQNIDRLHQAAGSRDVVEMHGSLW
jgi:hypothetical protein